MAIKLRNSFSKRTRWFANAPARTQPDRILIDCTDTSQRAVITGIQRVVRSLVGEAEKLGRECSREITGAVLGASGFEPCFPGGKIKAHRPRPAFRDHVLDYLPSSYVRSAEWLCRQTKSQRLRRWLLPAPQHHGIFKPTVKLIELARKLAGRQPPQPSASELGKGDMLIMADLAWANLAIWDHVRAARAQGVFVVTVVYDIIPITHPQFVTPGVTAGFLQYLREVVASSDLVVAISQTVRDQLRQQLPQMLPEMKTFPQIEGFKLGADFADKREPVRHELIDLFSHSKQPTPYLTVSTIDPRKNQGFTLEAIEKLWSRGVDARLVFVGMRGHRSDEFLEKVETHPELGKRLFMFHDLSDSELFYCYQHTRGTISSSFVEGFGLPVVESLWHGRKTFASDIPVFHEVGGDHVVYFGLSSCESLASALEKWENELAKGASLQQRRVVPISWRESTELLLQESLAAYTDANRPVSMTRAA